MYITYKLHVSANAAVPNIRLDTIFQRNYVELCRTIISISVGRGLLYPYRIITLDPYSVLVYQTQVWMLCLWYSNKYNAKGKLHFFPVRTIKSRRVNRGTAPFILKLGTRWSSVVILTPGRCTTGKQPRYPPNRRLRGPQGLPGLSGE